MNTYLLLLVTFCSIYSLSYGAHDQPPADDSHQEVPLMTQLAMMKDWDNVSIQKFCTFFPALPFQFRIADLFIQWTMATRIQIGIQIGSTLPSHELSRRKPWTISVRLYDIICYDY